MRFRDRRDAGRRLAERLAKYGGRADVLVLALPRGGVPVGFEVAQALGAPLGVFLVRKLGVPGHEELAMGAIASGGVRVLNPDVVHAASVSEASLAAVTAREAAELERRERDYLGGRRAPEIAGRTVILVDDGLATGATMRAAVAGLRRLAPQRVVAAVPVASPEACSDLAGDADEVVCVATPRSLDGVGRWYDDFSQTGDAEVRDLLDEAARARITALEPPSLARRMQ